MENITVILESFLRYLFKRDFRKTKTAAKDARTMINVKKPSISFEMITSDMIYLLKNVNKPTSTPS